MKIKGKLQFEDFPNEWKIIKISCSLRNRI